MEVIGYYSKSGGDHAAGIAFIGYHIEGDRSACIKNDNGFLVEHICSQSTSQAIVPNSFRLFLKNVKPFACLMGELKYFFVLIICDVKEFLGEFGGDGAERYSVHNVSVIV